MGSQPFDIIRFLQEQSRPSGGVYTNQPEDFQPEPYVPGRAETAADAVRAFSRSLSSDPQRGEALAGILERVLPGINAPAERIPDPSDSRGYRDQLSPYYRNQGMIENENRQAFEMLQRQMAEAQIANLQSEAQARLAPAQEAMRLGPGDVRIGPDGQPTFQAPFAPQQGPNTPFEAWQAQNPQGNVVDWLALQQQGQGVMSPEAFQQRLELAKQSRSSAYSGQEIEPYVESLARGEMGIAQIPAQLRSAVLAAAQERGIDIISDTERGQITSFKKVQPILRGVAELSEKINTGAGIIARARGAVEKAKAQANYADDLSEYNALVMGFTPLLARAVGHVGVLTEQDVQSVRELFPKPGDSKSVRDRKINRMTQIMSGVQEATEAGITAPTGAAPSGTGAPSRPSGVPEDARWDGQRRRWVR